MSGYIGLELTDELWRVIWDELGAYETSHPAMEGMSNAVYARVILALVNHKERNP